MKTFFNLKSLTVVFLLASLVLIQAGCEDDAGAGYGKQEKDIVDTAVSAGQFETLVTALKAADLVDTLKSPGPFTVFAPTDTAFGNLPDGLLEDLLEPENKSRLSSILKYHVVSGKVTAEEVKRLNSAKTVNGQPVYIMVKNGKVMINEATVTETDIDCSNGIIHIIDTVLIP